MPSMFQAFDFASPDLTTGRRETTVVPQQALFMMNNSLVVEQAKNVDAPRETSRRKAAARTLASICYIISFYRSFQPHRNRNATCAGVRPVGRRHRMANDPESRVGNYGYCAITGLTRP